ncbi:hypothetical protein VI817_004530 [Penicillium citrinum]|nr:hypothetical protein VI817_004530 [Penicillium citrinum]
MVFIKSSAQSLDVSAEFLQQKGDNYHEALGAKAHYNQLTTWFEPLPEPGDTTSDEDLRIALFEYNETTEERFRLNLASYTLNDVLLEIIEADGRYTARGKGITHAHRQIARSTGNNAAAIGPWLGLIPSDEGLSVLTGGLKVILDIAQKNAENRQKILHALHGIPDVIFQTQKQQNIFSADSSIREKAIDLYKVLVGSLAHLIATLNPSKAKDKFRDKAKRLGKKLIPYHTAADIDAILGDVATSVAKFQDSLQLIRDGYLVDTHQNTESLLDQGNQIHASTEVIGEDVSHIRQELSSLKRGFDESRLEQQIRHRDEVDSKNYFLVFVRSDPPETPFIAAPYIHQPQQPQPFLSDSELYHSLGLQVNEPIEDVDQVLKHRDQFDIATHTQAQQLLSSEQFMGWMKSPLAETLLVKGNFQMAGSGRISVLSTLCATLSLHLSRNTPHIVMTAFCGLHEAHSHDSHEAGPNWLIRSLIAQLLLSGVTFNMDFINTRSFAEQIKSHYLQDLCSIFRQLIEQLPNTATVICIIDSIARFEYERWQEDLVDVLQILDMIVQNEYLKPTFKLLLTTPFSNARLIEDSSKIWSHYTVCLRPTASTSGRRISERGLLRGRSLEEYRARMQQDQGNQADSEDEDEDNIFF